MQRYSRLTLPLIAFFLFASLAQAGQPAAARLRIGDAFPQVSGQTLTGKSLELPSAAASRRAVVIFSFSKAAGKDARLWSIGISKDLPQDVPIYSVIMLESVPKLFRSMVVSGIQDNMPLPMQDRTIVLYRDEKLWKQRLAVTDDRHAYVVLLGPGGRIRWSNSGAASDAQSMRLKNEILK